MATTYETEQDTNTQSNTGHRTIVCPQTTWRDIGRMQGTSPATLEILIHSVWEVARKYFQKQSREFCCKGPLATVWDICPRLALERRDCSQVPVPYLEESKEALRDQTVRWMVRARTRKCQQRHIYINVSKVVLNNVYLSNVDILSAQFPLTLPFPWPFENCFWAKEK